MLGLLGLYAILAGSGFVTLSDSVKNITPSGNTLDENLISTIDQSVVTTLNNLCGICFIVMCYCFGNILFNGLLGLNILIILGFIYPLSNSLQQLWIVFLMMDFFWILDYALFLSCY